MSQMCCGSGLLKVVGRVGSNCFTSSFESSKKRLKCDSLANDQTTTLGCEW